MYPKEMTTSARELLEYLAVIMDKNNVAIAPVLEIQERIGMSTASIARAKAQLMELDYVRARTAHVYMVNPSRICKANGDARAAVYEAYSLLPHKDAPKNEPEHDALENNDETRRHKRPRHDSEV